MSGGLTVNIEKRAVGFHAALSGEITEESNFEPILESKSMIVTLDLEGITRINSTGVREWINFVTALQKSGARITLEKCSVPIVQQLNMIANFRGGGTVVSVFAPYFCENCDQEHTRLLPIKAGAKPDLDEPALCPTCNNAMEFDDLPETYLSFMDV